MLLTYTVTYLVCAAMQTVYLLWKCKISDGYLISPSIFERFLKLKNQSNREFCWLLPWVVEIFWNYGFEGAIWSPILSLCAFWTKIPKTKIRIMNYQGALKTVVCAYEGNNIKVFPVIGPDHDMILFLLVHSLKPAVSSVWAPNLHFHSK